MRTLFILSAAALALSACAGAATTPNQYDTDLKQLARDCEARGGILAPTGAMTGRPQTENVCKVTGGASPLTRPGG